MGVPRVDISNIVSDQSGVRNILDAIKREFPYIDYRSRYEEINAVFCFIFVIFAVVELYLGENFFISNLLLKGLGVVIVILYPFFLVDYYLYLKKNWSKLFLGRRIREVTITLIITAIKIFLYFAFLAVAFIPVYILLFLVKNCSNFIVAIIRNKKIY